ncbi:MAG TPA: DUF6602 domain-containing protein [Steroidobacteraceae bacterium]|jgi:hypothetical protein|nr:DUF6602 domain-containing protein [Steroidobacteraceae bacterium]
MFSTGMEDRGQILKSFRKVTRSYVELFRAQRDQVYVLLGGQHNYSSGTFREGLLRNFLASVLPTSVSVDSGFIYGFDQVPNSRQIDILIWDSSRHSAIFRTGEFVIVSPESVVAAISVKTVLDRSGLRDSLDNLHSIVPLDLAYRRAVHHETSEPLHRPVLKLIVAYEGPANPATALKTVGEYYEDLLAADLPLAKEMRSVFTDFDPVRPADSHVRKVDSIFPAMIAAIESNEMSLLRGWGPPQDRTASQVYGPGLRRLPYVYAQDSKLTTPLEKIVYQVLTSTYAALGTTGWSLVAAWGEMDPVLGFRFGDADEVLLDQSARLLDPDRLADT